MSDGSVGFRSVTGGDPAAEDRVTRTTGKALLGAYDEQPRTEAETAAAVSIARTLPATEAADSSVSDPQKVADLIRKR